MAAKSRESARGVGYTPAARSDPDSVDEAELLRKGELAKPGHALIVVEA